MGFAGRWHATGKVGRAVRFMINTGRGEFAPVVWPLISDPDAEVLQLAGGTIQDVGKSVAVEMHQCRNR